MEFTHDQLKAIRRMICSEISSLLDELIDEAAIKRPEVYDCRGFRDEVRQEACEIMMDCFRGAKDKF